MKKKAKKRAAAPVHPGQRPSILDGYSGDFKPEIKAILDARGVPHGVSLTVCLSELLAAKNETCGRLVTTLIDLQEQKQWTKDIVAWIRRKEPELETDEAALVFVRNTLSWWRENVEREPDQRKYSE